MEQKSDTLFYVFHNSLSVRIKVQVLVFVFQLEKVAGQLSDRFYRLLY